MMLLHDALLDEVLEHQCKPYLRSDQRHQDDLLVVSLDILDCLVPSGGCIAFHVVADAVLVSCAAMIPEPLRVAVEFGEIFRDILVGSI